MYSLLTLYCYANGGLKEQEQDQHKQDTSEGRSDIWSNKQDQKGAAGRQDATARKFFSDCFSLLLLCFSLNHFPNHLQPPNCVYMLHSSNFKHIGFFLSKENSQSILYSGIWFPKIYSQKMSPVECEWFLDE